MDGDNQTLIEMLELLYYNSDADTTKPIHQIIEDLLDTKPEIVTKPVMTSSMETDEQTGSTGVTSENVTQDERVMTSQNTMKSTTEVMNEEHVMQTTTGMTSQRDVESVLNFVVIVGMTVLILGFAMFFFWKKMLVSI